MAGLAAVEVQARGAGWMVVGIYADGHEEDLTGANTPAAGEHYAKGFRRKAGLPVQGSQSRRPRRAETEEEADYGPQAPSPVFTYHREGAE